MIKLGISAFYHDSAACITMGNIVMAAAEEERFTGIKHDSSFPKNAIKWLLRSTVTDIKQIQEVHWYENPEIKDDRVKTIFNKRPIKTFFLRQRYKNTEKITLRKLYYSLLGTPEKSFTTTIIILMLLSATSLVLIVMQQS